MPNLDHRGPEGNGPQTGKQQGICNSSNAETGLGRRLKLHNKGCKGKSQYLLNTSEFRNIDVIGIKKKCKKKHN
jgi:hypothetical protein